MKKSMVDDFIALSFGGLDSNLLPLKHFRVRFQQSQIPPEITSSEKSKKPLTFSRFLIGTQCKRRNRRSTYRLRTSIPKLQKPLLGVTFSEALRSSPPLSRLRPTWGFWFKLFDGFVQIRGSFYYLVPWQGVYCSLRQLLEDGFFHADPHPGNLVATDDGCLAYFDFGMMGDIPRHFRVGLIKVLVHFVNQDSWGLANDFLSLGFLPDEEDIQLVAEALRASFDSDRRLSNDFQGVMYHLYDVMYEFNFSLPPDYALVIRALGSLEGTAKALDPDFKVIESAYPFVVGRLLSDPDPDIRKILRELLIRNDGSIRWNRLERLVAAISDPSAETTNESPDSASRAAYAHGWKSFDMNAVVAATEDLLCFVLSVKGQRVRIFLLQDIIKAADAFLQEEALPCLDVAQEIATKSNQERVDLISRMWRGLQSFARTVSLAPEPWAQLFIRMLLKPEFHRFVVDIFSAVADHFKSRLPEALWLCLSRILHHLHQNNILRHS